jgi:hypothetical protein
LHAAAQRPEATPRFDELTPLVGTPRPRPSFANDDGLQGYRSHVVVNDGSDNRYEPFLDLNALTMMSFGGDE